VSDTVKDGRQNKIGLQDRTENNWHQMQIKSIQPQENRRPALRFGAEGMGSTDGFGLQRGKQQNRSGREAATKKIR
jgi:hypothetical protein